MTNVQRISNKATTSRRLLLALAVGAAVISFLMLGTSTHLTRRVTINDGGGNELITQNEVLASPFMLDQNVLAMLRELDLQQDTEFFNLRASLLSQPQFDIQENESAVTVKVKVPKDVPIEEIQVEVRKGSVLHIQGGHKDETSQIRFEKTFTLGRHMDPDSITATLSKDRELVVTALKVTTKEKEVRKIDVKTEL